MSMDKTHQVGGVGHQVQPTKLPGPKLQHRVQDGGVAKRGTGEHLGGTPVVEEEGRLGCNCCLASSGERHQLCGGDVANYTAVEGLGQHGGAPKKGCN
jgi:hypothetical protein